MKLRNIFFFALVGVTMALNAQKKLVILHSNDTHSRIEGFAKTDKRNPDLGGIVARASIIDSIRLVEKNVLLLDIGDLVQGTPYFNLFHGRVEAKAMSIMKYDAATIGNHEFDYGMDTLKMIIEKTHVPFVCANYDFSKTVLKDVIKPYIILKKDKLKIGIIGVGANPEGLIQKDKYEGMIYSDPITSANQYAKKLKEDDKCDLIICLSHIGYRNDIAFAKESQYIDIILGGHSHTHMENIEHYKNKEGKEVTIFQNGKDGTYIGKLEVKLDKVKR